MRPALETAPDAMAFLRATVNPTNAVVGQQMTLGVYAYGNRGAFEETYSSEPSCADFVSQVVVDNFFRQPSFMIPIAGKEWTAVKVREACVQAANPVLTHLSGSLAGLTCSRCTAVDRRG